MKIRTQLKAGGKSLNHSEALAVRSVEPARALTSLGNEACLSQHLQVVRNGLPGDIEMGRDLARGELAVPHESQDLAPLWVGYRLQRRLHRSTLTVI